MEPWLVIIISLFYKDRQTLTQIIMWGDIYYNTLQQDALNYSVYIFNISTTCDIIQPFAATFKNILDQQFSNKIIPNPIWLTFIWTASMLLLIFLGQQRYQTFRQSHMYDNPYLDMYKHTSLPRRGSSQITFLNIQHAMVSLLMSFIAFLCLIMFYLSITYVWV